MNFVSEHEVQHHIIWENNSHKELYAQAHVYYWTLNSVTEVAIFAWTLQVTTYYFLPLYDSFSLVIITAQSVPFNCVKILSPRTAILFTINKCHVDLFSSLSCPPSVTVLTHTLPLL